MTLTDPSQRTEAQLLQAARQALGLIDLTRLAPDDTERSIERLCLEAKTAHGTPAAVCVYPQFVVAAKRALAAHQLGGSVKVAAVTNFPAGNGDIITAARDTRDAVASGADEVDVVFPYHALIAGDEGTGLELVEMCKAACAGQASLKVIIESGVLDDAALIQRASELAIEGGADFIKTSTGKVEINATLEAAEIMLEAIKASGQAVGFKAAGGIRTVEEAADYMAVASRVMGASWLTPANFRFGASSLLGSVLSTLSGESTSSTLPSAY